MSCQIEIDFLTYLFFNVIGKNPQYFFPNILGKKILGIFWHLNYKNVVLRQQRAMEKKSKRFEIQRHNLKKRRIFSKNKDGFQNQHEYGKMPNQNRTKTEPEPN